MKRQTIPKSLDGIRRKTDGTRIIASESASLKPRDFNFYSIAKPHGVSSRASRQRIQRKKPRTR